MRVADPGKMFVCRLASEMAVRQGEAVSAQSERRGKDRDEEEEEEMENRGERGEKQRKENDSIEEKRKEIFLFYFTQKHGTCCPTTL